LGKGGAVDNSPARARTIVKAELQGILSVFLPWPWNCGIGSRFLKALVNASDKLHIVRGENSPCCGSKYRRWTSGSRLLKNRQDSQALEVRAGLVSELWSLLTRGSANLVMTHYTSQLISEICTPAVLLRDGEYRMPV